MSRAFKTVGSIVVTLGVMCVIVIGYGFKVTAEAENERREGDRREQQLRLQLRDACRNGVEQYLGGSARVFDWDRSYRLRPGSNVFTLEKGVRVDIEADTGGNWREFTCYVDFDGRVGRVVEG